MNIATATQLIADYLAANLIGGDVAQAANAAIRQPTAYGDELNDSNRGRLLSLVFGIRTSSPVNFAPAYTVLEG
ncbi:hypothetical protein [Stenotrophomonas maltophilia]|uniref:hypothetical protein n=1 Tax=Stenotrophomonas maltophilia TaxID=40324 RepID=UPI0013DACFF4|nr:hypothetical protein [Stenotrophomonas maltophilia]MBN5116022.1 hypothetical protein [Stenotrophomonas maltophilia]